MNTRSAAFQAITSWTVRQATDSRSGPTSGAEEEEWGRWAAAVNQMARGYYAEAWTCFTGLAASQNPEMAGLAHAALASGLRQLGAHSQAVDHDDRAMSSCGVARLDGLVGRGADEIGLGDPERCREYLARADRMLDSLPDQELRGRVRISWVAAEVALVLGEVAVEPAQRAVDAAVLLGSPRHLLKSSLIRGVAMRAAGDPGGETELRGVLRRADEIGIRTLVWPAALALEDALSEDQGRRAAAAVADIRAHLPNGQFDSWIAAVDRLDARE
jgi:hypothetical protein